MSAAEMPVHSADFVERILLHPRLQFVEANGVTRNIVGVVEIFVDDDVHHAQRERRRRCRG